jgi:hypothetical protein
MAPFLVAIALWPSLRSPKILAGRALIICLYCLLIGGFSELASLAKLGFQAKVALNPAIYYRKDTPVITQTWRNVESILIADPLQVFKTTATAEKLMDRDKGPALARWVFRGFPLSIFAGTLVLCFSPFVLGLLEPDFWRKMGPWLKVRGHLILVAVVSVSVLMMVIASAYLTAYGTILGIAQSCLLAVQLLGLAAGAYVLQLKARPLVQGLVQVALILTGGGAIAAVCAAVSYYLTPQMVRLTGMQAYALSLSNVKFMIAHKTNTLALGFYPVLPSILLILAILLFAVPALAKRRAAETSPA